MDGNKKPDNVPVHSHLLNAQDNFRAVSGRAVYRKMKPLGIIHYHAAVDILDADAASRFILRFHSGVHPGLRSFHPV